MERIKPLPSFPKCLRHPTVNGLSRPLWKSADVIDDTLTVFVCPACFQIVEREVWLDNVWARKGWPSYCDATGQDVRLHKLGPL